MLTVKSAVGKVTDSIVYALSDGICKDYYLVDISDFAVAKSLLPKDAQVRGVFITHGHHDHIMGINELKATYPECVVYVSDECQSMLVSSKANLSYYKDTVNEIEYHGKVSILHDSDEIELFDGIGLKVVATPGHHPSCLSFLVGNYFFTGDSYIPGVKVVTKLPGGDRQQAQASMLKIMELGKGKKICAGHRVGVA